MSEIGDHTPLNTIEDPHAPKWEQVVEIVTLAISSSAETELGPEELGPREERVRGTAYGEPRPRNLEFGTPLRKASPELAEGLGRLAFALRQFAKNGRLYSKDAVSSYRPKQKTRREQPKDFLEALDGESGHLIGAGFGDSNGARNAGHRKIKFVVTDLKRTNYYDFYVDFETFNTLPDEIKVLAFRVASLALKEYQDQVKAEQPSQPV